MRSKTALLCALPLTLLSCGDPPPTQLCDDTLPPTCDGDTLLICDDNKFTIVTCNAGCEPDPAARCIVCGDGTLDVSNGEACDDGNNIDGDGCDNDCQVSIPPGCGDGITNNAEECDDANASNNDACTNACQNARCGDTFVQPGEVCDDGNIVDGDGCDPACQISQDPSDLQILPPDNPWNTRVDALPVHPLSDQYIASIGANTGLHADFGADPAFGNEFGFGIPFVIVGAGQPLADVVFDEPDESDPGPYPIPEDAPIEVGGDRHVIVIDRDAEILYEVFASVHEGFLSWSGFSGAIFDLNSNALRPDFFTSADAAGLPIFPGLVRVDEVLDAGEINHALRFTVSNSQRGFIHPATHFASNNTDPNLPPMGLRLRLKSTFDITPFPQDVQVILTALKEYGMIVADNGSDWFISGAPSPRWVDDTLTQIDGVIGSDFEVVDTGPIITD